MKLKPIASNMTELHVTGGTILFSYETPVAAFLERFGGWYRTEKKWSVTTSRHINTWLDGAKAEVRPQEWFDSLVRDCGKSA